MFRTSPRTTTPLDHTKRGNVSPSPYIYLFVFIPFFLRFLSLTSISATNNLAYLLARDALHTLAAAARQAPAGLNAGVAGTGLQFEDPSRRVMKVPEVSSQASSKVRTFSELMAAYVVQVRALFSPRAGREQVGPAW